MELGENEEIKQIYERVAWLEHKIVRLLWLAISGASMFEGFIVANVTVPDKGVPWFVVFVGVWLVLGFILQRQELKGAPTHIEFIDP